MIQKLKDNPVKLALIICGTILAAVSMITGACVPEWVIRIGALMVGAG